MSATSEDAYKAKIVRDARFRAKRDSIPFDLSVDDLIIPLKCPILGLTLVRHNPGSPAPNSTTLDKIKPDLGYVKGNVQFVSHKANTMKNNLALNEMEKVLHYMKNPSKYSMPDVEELQDKAASKKRREPLIANSRKRAVKKGLSHSMTPSDITLPLRCPVLGIDLDYYTKVLCDQSATLDRKDNDKGYYRENCVIVSRKVNASKSNSTVAEYTKLVKYMRKLTT